MAVVPPGEATSNIIPTANAGASPKTFTIPKQITGNNTTWVPNATSTALGIRATRAKSPVVRLNPSPNMMIANAIGNKTEVSTESDKVVFPS
ncbi:hypothetical protein GCM10009745_52380 [Kribbella yunnanensis]|uniref:Uncharacterized protein n=1 Tax=Kribbella yunnanensis TaxID=190194 RepID=A0ABN2I6X6_9ACTN